MGISTSLLQEIHKNYLRTGVPDLKSGMTVRIHQKIKEGGKERVQIYEGLVIKISSGTAIEKTFTVRKIVDGVGVERIFPLHSSNIKKIDIVKVGKVRRAKLYYMRDRSGKSARLKEKFLDLKGEDLDQIKKDALAAVEREKVEEPVMEVKEESTQIANEPHTSPTEETGEDVKKDDAKDEVAKEEEKDKE
ncbi:50S ribosomal protein L19 [Candidatus Peregrinibacteria bacterium RIFOXYC2_FULL_33_13]|nr:MAG: 50S ribosomal protein L19 [Candidatus Peregrinibacteria bacterium GW2011_GWA2_33_10]KKP38574.1 MAG: 50S ribosomal protein L19, large subunit ribosomal protein L19 [Candidatus Peregrinibacteria bacterium GW2011_GWC2_33_13]OGJ49443.1 MAG: 50S ribosomal protein L19 [Candidatus Peregrinibacteria bacterium RIFOXYA2_FULL_33_7]OGJ55283.1 MAG: 50S ribosomal protein L19 [Candidatus Peregrinibacteria bacterium RIFOXYC2_FULL_33_13]